jgi:hypothetical protein
MLLKTDKIITFIFNTEADNSTFTNATNVSFYVNFSGFLNQDYDNFLAEFVFKSEPVAYAAGTPKIEFVNINFANTNINTGQGKQQNIGFIYPSTIVVGGTTYYTYSSNSNDNLPFILNKPYSNNVTTFNLKNSNNTSALMHANNNVFPNWSLILKLTPIVKD